LTYHIKGDAMAAQELAKLHAEIQAEITVIVKKREM